MEKSRSSKKIIVIVLLIAVMALSVGFAAFTQSLDISSNAYVSPSDTVLDVIFTSSNPIGDPPVYTVIGNATVGVSALAAIINNGGSNPVISNLGATFTDKGQSVNYSFYVYNNSAYTAYLRSVIFENVTGGSANIVCISGAETTESTVNSASGAACDDINVKISIAGDDYISSNNSISLKSLDASAYQSVNVTISYDGVHSLPDGDFSVSIGDITLGYSSIDLK